ncbi:unnamed protein product [Camellia sinensis]
MSLPTNPRQRTAEELDRSKLGGGFRSYGCDRNRGDEGLNSMWGKRRVGFESNGGADSENWVKKKEEEGRKFGTNDSGGPFDSLRERRGGFDSATNGSVDAEAWGKKREEGSEIGRLKLNLQPRTLPVSDGQQNGSVTQAKPGGSLDFILIS